MISLFILYTQCLYNSRLPLGLSKSGLQDQLPGIFRASPENYIQFGSPESFFQPGIKKSMQYGSVFCGILIIKWNPHCKGDYSFSNIFLFQVNLQGYLRLDINVLDNSRPGTSSIPYLSTSTPHMRKDMTIRKIKETGTLARESNLSRFCSPFQTGSTLQGRIYSLNSKFFLRRVVNNNTRNDNNDNNNSSKTRWDSQHLTNRLLEGPPLTLPHPFYSWSKWISKRCFQGNPHVKKVFSCYENQVLNRRNIFCQEKR